jgi:ubiquinone/menaquinone biosynthesis C-methylase UbiE
VNLITSENVAAAFDEVAPRYDFMVALNPGYHAHLRSAANALVEWLPMSTPLTAAPPVRILDLGCGSAHPPAPCCALRRQPASDP